ncbi:MAG: hypothetical protein R3D60_09635 [Paracoccaceae bacterium]
MSLRTPRFRLALRIGFAAALLFVAVFAVRTVASLIYWSDEAHQEQPIEGWMMPGYVGRSWGVPREVIEAALGAQDGAPSRRSLEQIAEAQGITLPELIARIEMAIADFRRAHPDSRND